jgi:hypothetical protein
MWTTCGSHSHRDMILSRRLVCPAWLRLYPLSVDKKIVPLWINYTACIPTYMFLRCLLFCFCTRWPFLMKFGTWVHPIPLLSNFRQVEVYRFRKFFLIFSVTTRNSCPCRMNEPGFGRVRTQILQERAGSTNRTYERSNFFSLRRTILIQKTPPQKPSDGGVTLRINGFLDFVYRPEF